MAKLKKINTEQQLVKDIALLIEESRQYVATAVNTTLVVLYWKIGSRINSGVLKNKRAEYGKQIVVSLSRQLVEKYGNGWDAKTLRHCLRIAETFSEDTIVY
jgi:phosphoribosylformimino-5-aminoimidazole carboxamide ribonucleotide (ProFAR) isomerase